MFLANLTTVVIANREKLEENDLNSSSKLLLHKSCSWKRAVHCSLVHDPGMVPFYAMTRAMSVREPEMT